MFIFDPYQNGGCEDFDGLTHESDWQLVEQIRRDFEELDGTHQTSVGKTVRQGGVELVGEDKSVSEELKEGIRQVLHATSESELDVVRWRW